MMSVPKILIVDDAGYIRVLFRDALKINGYEIKTVDNAEGAYDIIKKFNPHVILLDINLPDKSGLELLKQLREEKIDIPVIIISAISFRDTVIEASRYNIAGYLTKPIDIDILRERVKSVFDKYYSDI